MILDFWNKIAYMVQLLAACSVCLFPVRKRNPSYQTILTAACLLLLAYGVNSVYPLPENGILSFTYWAFYIIACVGFSWLWLGGELMQALYCTAFACGIQHIAFDLYLIHHLLGGHNIIVDFMLYFAVYLLFYWIVARKLPEYGRFAVTRQSVLPIITMILLVWILSILENSELSGFAAGDMHRILYRVIDGLCCVYVLWVQLSQKERISLQRELDGISAAWQQQKRQYEMTSDTIDTINRKCHDLKHQLRAIRMITDEKEKDAYFEEIEEAIMIYDTALATGNRALDTVLMEKGLFCQNHGIGWSCMVDGSRLEFMRPEDIYAILGNALDNAIKAVMEVTDPQKRVISVKIIPQSHLVVIQIQNYYEKELCFKDGLPVTTQDKRNHGFGMKSIRHTAEKYHGTITVQAQDAIFMLQILIPQIDI